ncbi:sensor histidine kinase [Candidatus Solirubrobacter pratensis]|uniref:sensor histidine kinase n=1 Tax=Candidatus Solirubrobacter pratensis TaxID=1298857 RepID=UPI0004254A3B|nr:sensor histidine kinase [Candidatus Solirubrobacter pratensis]
MSARPHDGMHPRHWALVYDDADRFAAGVGAFVREGVDRGERVLAALTREKAAWLREELGEDREMVEFADAGELYARPGPMLTAVVEYLRRHAAPGRGRVRVVAEQALATRAPADTRAYLRYEAASNVVYQRFAASVLCPYDAHLLPDAVVEDALRTHPEVLDATGPRRSDAFLDPRDFIRGRERVEAAPPGAPVQELERLEDIPVARRLAGEYAGAAGLSRATIEDMLVAVSEVATNALVHGQAPRCMWIYLRHDALVCHVHDGGPGLPDPLLGYLPPDSGVHEGRGLWLAHHFCDIVEVAADRSGTHVYLRMRL